MNTNEHKLRRRRKFVLTTAAGSGRLKKGFLKHLQVVEFCPAIVFPEGFAGGIAIDQVDVAACDSGAMEGREGCLD